MSKRFVLLEDRPKDLPKKWYPARRLPCRHGSDRIHALVVHTAENIPDFKPPDEGAEHVAHYGIHIKRNASWHVTLDSDSIIYMLPDSYTAWQCHKFNSCGLGVEIATKANRWSKAPEEWVSSTLTNLVKVIGDWCKEHDIPPRLISASQARSGEMGVTYHRFLDPSRRSDPGINFPQERFFSMLKEYLGVEQPSIQPRVVIEGIKVGDSGEVVRRLKIALHRWKGDAIIERSVTAAFEASDVHLVKEYQKHLGIEDSGIITSMTAAMLSSYLLPARTPTDKRLKELERKVGIGTAN